MEEARPGSVGEDAEDWRRRPRDIVGRNVFGFRNEKSEEYFTSCERCLCFFCKNILTAGRYWHIILANVFWAFSKFSVQNSRLPFFPNYANEEEGKKDNDDPCHNPDCEGNHVDLGCIVHIGERVCRLQELNSLKI